MDTNLRICVTKTYDKFKRLEGNRRVLEPRVKKIISSINKVGQIPSPIIVNEKYEVIDGQGRLEALKRLGLPVYYTIVPGIGIDECIAMNINQSNWTLNDYIETYAETGSVSYMYLLQLLKAYGKTFQQKVIIMVTSGKKENPSAVIKTGRFQCTAEMYKEASNVLSYLSGFTGIFARMKGHTEYYYMALAFCYRDPEVDNVRLIEKVTQLQANLIPVTTMLQALEQIENIYNNRCRNRVYLKTNYRKLMDSKYNWYEGKYGNQYK